MTPNRSIEQWPIERLKPYARNARVHPQKQLQQLRSSLKQFGWTIPILVSDDGTIIAGHGRLQAALLEHMTEVPVLIARGWTDKMARAYRVADNQLALTSDWSNELLIEELLALKDDDDIDMGALGFEDKQLMRMLADEPPLPPELVPTFQILIECTNEAQQAELLTKLAADNIRCRALIA
jgi:ParB-like chromosome segregation protein Spo0J